MSNLIILKTEKKEFGKAAIFGSLSESNYTLSTGSCDVFLLA